MSAKRVLYAIALITGEESASFMPVTVIDNDTFWRLCFKCGKLIDGGVLPFATEVVVVLMVVMVVVVELVVVVVVVVAVS